MQKMQKCTFLQDFFTQKNAIFQHSGLCKNANYDTCMFSPLSTQRPPLAPQSCPEGPRPYAHARVDSSRAPIAANVGGWTTRSASAARAATASGLGPAAHPAEGRATGQPTTANSATCSPGTEVGRADGRCRGPRPLKVPNCGGRSWDRDRDRGAQLCLPGSAALQVLVASPEQF